MINLCNTSAILFVLSQSASNLNPQFPRREKQVHISWTDASITEAFNPPIFPTCIKTYLDIIRLEENLPKMMRITADY
jgi:hypothetical protein